MTKKYYLVLVLLVAAFGCSKKQSQAPAPVTSTPTAEEEIVQQKIAPEQAGTPMDAIKELDRKIDSYKTGKNLTPAEEAENKKLKRQILRGTFDIKELSRLALAQHWNTLSENDRTKFVDLMTQLLERKAIFSKEQVKGTNRAYTVQYKSQKYLEGEKKKANVLTTINVPSEKIELNIQYSLGITEYGWKIYDVIVDDASLVDNYKFQFDTIIKKYGYPELIARMEKKLKEME